MSRRARVLTYRSSTSAELLASLNDSRLEFSERRRPGIQQPRLAPGAVPPAQRRASRLARDQRSGVRQRWEPRRQLGRSWKTFALGTRTLSGIDLMRNYGQHNALLCGLQASQGDVIVTMDDDLQHPTGAEFTSCSRDWPTATTSSTARRRRQQHGILRNLASRITKRVLEGAMGAEVATRISAWRAIRRAAASPFGGYRDAFVSIDVLLTWSTSRFAWVTVEHEPRTIGQSNYTVGKLVRHALNMLTGYSTLPLRLASVHWLFLHVVRHWRARIRRRPILYFRRRASPVFRSSRRSSQSFPVLSSSRWGSSASISLECTREAWIVRCSSSEARLPGAGRRPTERDQAYRKES